jgi:hypothetical protein
MTALIDDVVEDIRTDFLQLRADLLDARRAQQSKDTPASRAAVAQQSRQIDVLLDLYLALSDARGWELDQLPTLSTVSVPSSLLAT